MKNKITPSTVERVMREEDFIVSTTDLKGRITYGNRIFVEFSGYAEEELLGAQHNVIRHPDMPRGVFKLLWDTVQAGNECFAYVKNLTKDGGFYWVFANVTPLFDADGRIEGYFSVRRKPAPQALAVVGELYRQMLEAEQRAGVRDAIAASTALLQKTLSDKGMSYDEFILSI
ncbi:MAG: PAS domain S-box protein [Betaproteobacteria bacterium]|nr:PAS domain S-box protein [Betaproteobacteria bacterium]